MVVGALFYDTGIQGTGAAFVYFGGPDADDVADMDLSGVNGGDRFGWSVSGAGDVNGDGFDDVGTMDIWFATLGGFGGLPAEVEVALYDIGGRRVRTITRDAFTAGSQRVAWDGRDDAGRAVPSGVYFLRVEAPGNASALKLVVTR